MHSHLSPAHPEQPTAVIVSGQALGYILSDEMTMLHFLAVAMQAKAVVACRVSPPQKASLVRLVGGAPMCVCVSE